MRTKTRAAFFPAMIFVCTFACTLLSLAPTEAWALCPNCLGQSPSVPAAMKVVGIFLLVPPAVFFAIAFAIKKVGRQSRADGGDHRG